MKTIGCSDNITTVYCPLWKERGKAREEVEEGVEEREEEGGRGGRGRKREREKEKR